MVEIQITEQTEKKKFKKIYFVLIGLSIIFLLVIVLAFLKIFSITIALLIDLPILSFFIIYIIIKIMKKKPLELGKKKRFSVDEVENLCELFLKTRKFIEPSQLRVTLHQLGSPPTPLALVVATDLLDNQKRQIALIVNRESGDLSFLVNEDVESKRDFIKKIKETMNEMAEKPSQIITRGTRRISAEGAVVEETERVPAEIIAAQKLQEKEREKV